MEPAKPCPKCGLELVRRRPARSLTEGMLSIFFIYPFRCQLCAHRFVTFLGHYAPAPRREFMRLPAQYPTSVWLAGSQETAPLAEGTLLDLSIRGCATTCSAPLKEGLMVRLHIRPPEASVPLTIDGAIVRHSGRDRIGMQFYAVRAEEQLRLMHVMQDLWVKSELPAYSWKTPQAFTQQK